MQDSQTQETTHTIPHSFLLSVINGLQIGLENTEEIFIENGARNTRSERERAKRLQDEFTFIGNLITELKTFL